MLVQRFSSAPVTTKVLGMWRCDCITYKAEFVTAEWNWSSGESTAVMAKVGGSTPFWLAQGNAALWLHKSLHKAQEFHSDYWFVSWPELKIQYFADVLGLGYFANT